MVIRRERLVWFLLIFLVVSWSLSKVADVYKYKPVDLQTHTLEHVAIKGSGSRSSSSSSRGSSASSWVVVMPVITKEIAHMQDKFAEWSIHSPCKENEEGIADLVFFYHQTIDAEFSSHVANLVSLFPSFFRCFENLYALAAHLPVQEDGYPAGPNAMFYRLLLSNSLLHTNKYQYMFYFEQDMTVIRAEWLSVLQREVVNRGSFLILGSFPLHPANQECLSCNLHINGNAVYHLGDELRELVKRTYTSGGIFGYAYDQQFAKYLFEHCMPDKACSDYFSRTWPLLARTESMLNAWNVDWCMDKISEKTFLIHGGYNNNKRNETRVIALSLWGKNPRFHAQLLKNLRDGWFRVFPCWKVRVYTTRERDTDVADIAKLAAAGAEIVIAEDHPVLAQISNPMMWRFAVASDAKVDRFLIRDADTVVLQRDADAVNEWITSGKPFHVIRDHPLHCALLPEQPIMGGMWGGTRAAVPEMLDLIKEWPQHDKQFNDQMFLTKHILPLARQRGVLSHDSACCHLVADTISLPTPRRSTEYVGCYVASDDECSLGGHQNKCPDRNLALKPSFGELRHREELYYRTRNRRIFWLVMFLLGIGLWMCLRFYYGVTCNCRAMRHRWLQMISNCRRVHSRAIK